MKSIFIKFIAVLLIAILLSSVLSTFVTLLPPPPPDFVMQSQILSRDPLIQEWKEAIVEVRAITQGEDGEWMGTGFNVHSEGFIITADHIISDAEKILINFSKDEAYEPFRLFSFPEVDIAVILLDSKDLPYVNLQWQETPKKGDEVVIIGNPLGYSKIVIEGKITDIWVPSLINQPILEIEAPIHKGNSGSPVFDESGQVIGVVSAILSKNDEPIRGLAMPVSYIIDRLKIL